jgi:adenylate kinase
MDSPRFAVILVGPPGSGKTVVTDDLASRKEIATLKMGPLLREEIKRKTPLGDELKPFLETGHLAPVALVIKVVEQALERIDRKVTVFDGFPRDREQVAPFFQLSHRFDLKLAAVIVLDLPPALSIKRLSGRRICPNCGAVYNIYFDPPTQPDICDRCGFTLEQRPDDAPEIVQERLQTYQAETAPVVDYFQINHPELTFLISAEKPIPEVLQAVSDVLEKVGVKP